MKTIQGVDIFECQDCRIGFVNPRQIKDLSSQPDYDIKGYKKSEPRLRERFDQLIKLVLRFKNKGRVLDIGGGFGLFSSLLQKYGQFEIEVIEPSLDPFYLKGEAKVYRTRFEEFVPPRGKKYDLVIILDVLEHFNHPLKNLYQVRKILDRNGLMVIQTPNYKSLMARICKNWAWWMVEDHKYFFSPKSLTLLLKKTGFKPVLFKTYEDFFDFKKNLDGNFIDLRNRYQRRFLKGLFFLIFIPLYFLFRWLIWRLKYGGLILVIAKKTEG